MKVVKFNIDNEDWEAFVEKHCGNTRYSGKVSKRINELIKMDLDGRLEDSETTLTPYRRKQFKQEIELRGESR